ncbi:Glycosyltransferase involved in cell wall bisynthesis [Flavobacterium glycines]|nr:glycosyltransferase family 4 protein [Flavobacterium glycines]SDJ52949.1 Glycosyltransferase involved in cell wall bisynthesis [Flavobacterium glycines]
MVAIPNHHFFQWVNQLEKSGHEVYWFDSTDGGPEVSRISWVKQIKSWKLRWDFPFRSAIKKQLPKLYTSIQKYNERKVSTVFKQKLNEIQPDIVHCFEMRLAGFPILEVMEKSPQLKFMYSSWGSDIFYYKELGVQETQFKRFLSRVDYIITDCKRDFKIAQTNGYNHEGYSVIIGNGGLAIDFESIQTLSERQIIMIKGYEDGVGKALEIIKALELLPVALIKDFEIVIYSANILVKEYVEDSSFFAQLKVKIFERGQFVANSELLKIMGKSIIHVANSLSDGLPTSAVEAMGMGAFPIQSNPGKVTEEVIINGINGFLIEKPNDVEAIANLIKTAIENKQMRARAQEYNVHFVQQNYNRTQLQQEIINLYQRVKLN